jgi:hypothetical protein
MKDERKERKGRKGRRKEGRKGSKKVNLDVKGATGNAAFLLAYLQGLWAGKRIEEPTPRKTALFHSWPEPRPSRGRNQGDLLSLLPQE